MNPNDHAPVAIDWLASTAGQLAAARDRATALGDMGAQAAALSARARAALLAGDPHTAQRDLLIARDLDERRGDRRGLAERDRSLGEVALHPLIANPLLALHYFGLAVTRFSVLGDQISCARSRIGLAQARLRRGHHDTASPPSSVSAASWLLRART